MKIEDVTLMPFESEHAREVLKSLIEAKWIIAPEDEWDGAIKEWKKGRAFTLVVRGRIVGCGGVMLREKGKGKAWILATPLINNYRKTVFHVLMNVLDLIVRECGLRRVEATCPKGYEAGVRLLEHMGFVNETPDGMKQYGPGGETFYLYGRMT